MRKHLFRLFSIVFIFILLLSVSAQPAVAQEGQPPATRESVRSDLWPSDRPHSHESTGVYSPSQIQSLATDEYGYTWDDTVAFNWIDALSGTDSGLSGENPYTGPVDIGFPFKFYENTYSQLYFNMSGLVTFGYGTGANANTSLPLQTPPNNLIAVLWDVLAVGQPYNSGKVTYQQVGTAPDRSFVIEWYQVSRCCVINSTDLDTFEVILYENGDIVTQYNELKGILNSDTVGIEDSVGVSGLQYQYNDTGPGLSYPKAIRFSRTSNARLQVYPFHKGAFTLAGGMAAFQIPIWNTGDLGSDTYELVKSSSPSWPISLYAADGTTLLTDTDSDGVIDTGPVNQGDTVTIIARVQAPGGANIGDANTATLTIRSSLNFSKIKTVTLRTAIPAPFAQVYQDDVDGAMSLYRALPDGQFVTKTTDPNWLGSNPAVAEAPDGNFVYAWDKGRCLDSGCTISVNEIEYTLLNKYGETVRAVSKLTDNSAATLSTFDLSPVVAVAPDGQHIGVLWYHYAKKYLDYIWQYNYNLFFAVLDASGDITYGPVNLTNNSKWGGVKTSNVPTFSNPRITATGDNRFVLAWQTQYYVLVDPCSSNDCYINDIYYTVRSTNGSEVKTITQFTNDTTGTTFEGYFGPNLTGLTGNRALLTWYRDSDDDVYYHVMDSAGNLVKDKTLLSSNGTTSFDFGPDAIQLSDGKIVVGWTGSIKVDTKDQYIIRFAVLNTAYQVVAGPTILTTPAAVTGSNYISVTADNAGRAILTWTDYNQDYRRNLYYALVDGSGSILTQPMIFQASQASTPSIGTSFIGYGNTSYSSIPAGVDTSIWPGSSLVMGEPGGTVSIGIHYTNNGQTTATGVKIKATLGTGLTYLGDTSGVVPNIAGNLITWNLPNIGFLENHPFTLYVRVPGTATLGTRYPVALALTENETDANPGDNTANLEVMAVLRIYLPMIMR